jgi:hypothetical protein
MRRWRSPCSFFPMQRMNLMISMRLWLLVLVVALWSIGCSGTRVGPTPAGYFFWMETFHPPAQGPGMGSVGPLAAELELIVSVENGQGLPLDGILVEFTMDSAWTESADIIPTRVLSKTGKARAVFRARSVGRVRVTARVDTLTQDVFVNISQAGGSEP